MARCLDISSGGESVADPLERRDNGCTANIECVRKVIDLQGNNEEAIVCSTSCTPTTQVDEAAIGC